MWTLNIVFRKILYNYTYLFNVRSFKKERCLHMEKLKVLSNRRIFLNHTILKKRHSRHRPAKNKQEQIKDS